MTETKLNTQKSNDLDKAIATSCRILAIREHSEKQLRLKLQKKAYEKTAISECIQFLKEENWLSEERFCNAFIRSRVEKGQGLQRIEYELKQQDISREIVQRQLDCEDIDWQIICERVLYKKILLNGSAHRKFVTDADVESQHSRKLLTKDRKRIENFLMYRGFSVDQIKTAFGLLATSELRSSNK